MRLSQKLVLTAIATATLAATPAAAVVTTFASFNASSGGNIVYLNNGTAGSNSSYRSNGNGGSIMTTNSAFNVRPANAVPGAVGVTFSFLQPGINVLANVPALFTLNASVTTSPAQTLAGFKLMTNFSGTFSFISTTPTTYGGVTGTNLLSGTFSSGTIFGATNGTSGSFSGSTPTSTVSYTSDFLTFDNTNDRDFALSLTAITSLVSGVNRGLNNGLFGSPSQPRALRSFRATSTGSFSSDPAPRIVSDVPEPQIWGLLVIGFGMVGVTTRRRNRSVAA